MNDDRHKIKVELKEMTVHSNQFEKMKDAGLFKMAGLYEEIKKLDQVFISLKQDQFKRDSEANDVKVQLKNRINELEQDVNFKKSQVEQYENGMNKLQQAISNKDMQGVALQHSIAENLNEITILKRSKKELNALYEDTRLKMNKFEAKAAKNEMSMEEAIIAKNHAEEIAQTWGETVKSLKRQMKEDKERAEQTNILVYQTC